MPQPDPRVRFFDLLRATIADGSLVKLTLGKHRGADASLKNIFIRPVALKNGPRLSFVYRHATRDITKNHPPREAVALIEKLLGPDADFLDAHLFTATQTAQLECAPDGKARLRVAQAAEPARLISDNPHPPANPPRQNHGAARAAQAAAPACESENPGDAFDQRAGSAACATSSHDRARQHTIPATAPWLRPLGVTNDRGQVREGMAAKFRQINKFAELLSHLAAEAGLCGAAALECGTPVPLWIGSGKEEDTAPPTIRIADMGCGKGYLTFATAALFGDRARVLGIEARADLVDLCNRVAREQNFTNLIFKQGTITAAPLDIATGEGQGSDTPALDILIALHACDTATDDAIARGVAAGARLIVVSPCCQKELRAQLAAPAVLAPALRHGIFQERQAEFVTDALRALLLKCAGYRVKVFEFVSTEHTAKNLMIAAIKTRGTGDSDSLEKAREFARFYGIRKQTLAAHLDIALA